MCKFLSTAFLLLITSCAWAQYTTVTATVKDTSNNLYANGVYDVVFIAPSASQLPTLGGNAIFPKEVQGSLPSAATLSIRLADNSQITPSGSQWRFTICASDKVSCFNTTLTISGGSQDVTSSLQSAAVTLGATETGNLTFSGTNTHSGVETFTGNFTATAGQNTLNFYNHNGIVWVGNGAAYKYTTIEAAMAGSECSANGCRIVLVTGFSETNTAQMEIGSATQKIILEAQPDVHLTCNVTTGGASACWNIYNGSAMSGPQNGVTGASRVGGLHLKYACTAKTSYGINTPEGVAGTGQYVRLDHINFEGCNTGTVAGGGSPSVAAINIEGVQNMSDINNDQTFQFANTIEWRFASNSVAGQGIWGPHVLNNIWANCNNNTGCQPMKAIATGTPAAFLNFNLIGGAIVGPGAGLPMLEINGNSTATFALRGVTITGTYFENLVAAGGSIAIKLVDVLAANIVGVSSQMTNVDTFVDISQTAAGRSRNIHINGTASISTSTAYTMVNNHITGEVVTGTFLPLYNFGSDTSGSVQPFTISGNNLNYTDTAGRNLMQMFVTGNPTMQFQNSQDATYTPLKLDSGTTAAQQTQLMFSDRGTNKWMWAKLSDNSIGLQDVTNSKYRMNFAQNANPASAGAVRFITTETWGWRNNANTADLLVGKNTSDILTYAGLPHTVTVASDFTVAANTSLQLITGLTWTMPANEALTLPFSCHLMYSQATAAVADQFGIQDVTVAPTNIAAKATVWTSASVANAANLPTLASTTATAINTFTPSAITTVWNADIDGVIEQPSNASSSAIQIQVQTSNSADLITVKRGSFCTLNW